MSLNRVECRRCGYVWVVSANKRGRKDLLCSSCRSKRQAVIQYGKLRCEPFQGDLNSDLQPVDEFGLLLS